jgi:hypothetical protein
MSKHEPSSPSPSILERIGEALSDLRYGTVTIVVQDGIVVQVDRTEKFRLQAH